MGKQVFHEETIVIPQRETGLSFDSLLRFPDVHFPPGKFKMCLCDENLGNGKNCTNPRDYDIELGVVHSTGLYCLEAHQELRRHGYDDGVSCRNQWYGGLDCGAYWAAEPNTAPVDVV